VARAAEHDGENPVAFIIATMSRYSSDAPSRFVIPTELRQGNVGVLPFVCSCEVIAVEQEEFKISLI
jgi:hypothetical protein